MKKQCYGCNRTKELRMFYTHPGMVSGYLNKCKECTRKDVSKNYRTNKKHYHEYNKKREKDPKRIAKQLEYQRTYRSKYKGKNSARYKLFMALQDGMLNKKPCKICHSTTDVQAHHTDYRKALDVQWLCKKHHLTKHNKVLFINDNGELIT